MDYRNLRARVAFLGIHQREVAAKVGATEASVSRWLAGSQSIPVRFIRPLADVLRMTTDEVLATQERQDHGTTSGFDKQEEGGSVR